MAIYRAGKKSKIPTLYFTHKRSIVDRNGTLLAKSDFITLLNGEKYEERQIRFRTVGDMTCAGALQISRDEIIQEVASERLSSERVPLSVCLAEATS